MHVQPLLCMCTSTVKIKVKVAVQLTDKHFVASCGLLLCTVIAVLDKADEKVQT